nr:hypothetical protein [Tanacetum cinerariifolium]
MWKWSWHNQNSLNASPSISETSSQSPSNINHCCYECGYPLDGIFCKRCTWSVEDKILVPKLLENCARCVKCGHPKQEEKRIEEEQAANARYWKIPAYCDDDDDYDFAITPVLSTEEPIDSLSMGDEHLDTIPATESDERLKNARLVEPCTPETVAVQKGTLKTRYLFLNPLKTLHGNTSEPSNASTNVVNAPREPYVVKQDNESFVDNIIFDLNRAPDSYHLHTISPNQFHCFHYKDVLRDGEACKQCTCAKCRSGLGKGICYICGHNQNSLNASPSISETSSQSPPNINHCCYECGDPLDGIFCKRCTCKSCGKDAHIGYNCPSKVLVSSNPEPCNNQTIDELPRTLPIFHLTFHSEAKSPFTLDSTPTYVNESPNFFNPPPQPSVYPCEYCGNDAYYGHYCTLKLRLSIWSRDDDDDEERSDSLDDNIVSGLPPFFAITSHAPVLSTEEPDNSLSIGDTHLDTISATESDEFIKSGVETLIPILSESEGIPEHVCDVPSHDNSSPLDVSKHQFKDFSESNEEFSSIDDDSFSIDNIDYVEASAPDSKLVSSEVMEIVIPETKSPSTSLNSLLEETNTFDNSLPEFKTFCFDVDEISSGSTTTPPNLSLLEYEVFHDDHVK